MSWAFAFLFDRKRMFFSPQKIESIEDQVNVKRAVDDEGLPKENNILK